MKEFFENSPFFSISVKEFLEKSPFWEAMVKEFLENWPVLEAKTGGKQRHSKKKNKVMNDNQPLYISKNFGW